MRRNGRGDTIVEVLLAIGIAAFGIGITYATAQRGLRQTIAARERNQALNLIQNQINNLRARYQLDQASFEGSYGISSPHQNYCLDTSSIITNPHDNFNNDADLAQNLASRISTNPSQPYSSYCTYTKAGDGVTYYIDIKTSSSPTLPSNPHTLYQIFVRWEPETGSQPNQANENFKINGTGTATLLP